MGWKTKNRGKLKVLEIPLSDIEPPPEFGAQIRSDFIKGMSKVNGKFVILLDVNGALLVEEVAMLASVAHREASVAA